MKGFFLSAFIVLLALIVKLMVVKPNEHFLELKYPRKNQALFKQNMTTVPGTFKPIENLLRQTSLRCSSRIHMPFGVVNNYSIENLDFSTTAEPGNYPFNALKFHSKYKKPPRAFNDQWIKINTAKGLHNAARKDGRLDYVLKISKRMNLPPGIAILPIVESNYKNDDRSSAGAVGAWQLMPEVARDYGIKLHERSQIVPSTHAALHLLKDLYKKFHNWELAFAAYNAGGTRVANAIKKNPYAVSIEELDLPRETKDYIVRLKKINNLIKRFAHMRVNIAHLINDFEY